MKDTSIKNLIEQGEGEYIEFKRQEILSKNFELAREMVALANHRGGYILIGVDDGGQIKGVKRKKGHEEHIINIARDRCDPPITPKIKAHTIDGKEIYCICIPQRNHVLHRVKTTKGNQTFIRVGPTTIIANPYDISKLHNGPLPEPIKYGQIYSETDESRHRQKADLRMRDEKVPTMILDGMEVPYFTSKRGGWWNLIFSDIHTGFSEGNHLLEAFIGAISFKEFEKILAAYMDIFGESENAAFSVTQTNYAWFGFGKDNFIETLKRREQRYRDANNEIKLQTHHSEAACYVDEMENGIFYISTQPSCIKDIEGGTRMRYTSVGFLFDNLPFITTRYNKFFDKIECTPEHYSHTTKCMDTAVSFQTKDGDRIARICFTTDNTYPEPIPWINYVYCNNPHFMKKRKPMISDPDFVCSINEVNKELSSYDKMIVKLQGYHPITDTDIEYRVNNLFISLVPSSGFITAIVNCPAYW